MTPVRVVPLVAALCLGLQVTSASYDAKFCESKTSWAKDQAYTEKPFFFDDYSVVSEAAYFKVENESEAMVTHSQVYYSENMRQAVVSEESPEDTFWAFLDQPSRDCIYKKGSGQCLVEEGDCEETNEAIGLGGKKGDTIDLGSSSGTMNFPPDVETRKTVKFTDTYTRNIASTRVGICSYRQSTDETVVTILYVLRPDQYANMDSTQNTVLTAVTYTKTPDQSKPSFKRVDYTEYTKIYPAQLANGFQLGEGQCGTLKSEFTSRDLPQPSVRFSYFSQQLVAVPPFLTRAAQIVNEQHEYNENSQISQVQTDQEVAGQTEKNTILEVGDFRGQVSYKYSLTNGDCNVTTLVSRIQRSQQLSPRQFWLLDAGNPTYEGVYSNRDMPCDLWKFEGPDSSIASLSLYLANKDWLKANGLAENTFLPVEIIARADTNVYNEIYMYKDNPGYNIPYLSTCFQADDTLFGEVTLLMNYYQEIAARYFHFEYEFRKVLMDITGVNSPIRISLISFMPSPSKPDTETIALFDIHGKLTGFDDLSDNIYRSDPVTPDEASEKIKKKVDSGNIKFSLDNEKTIINFKKGSFAVSKSGKRFRYLDGRNGPAGYSGGAMAGAALGTLIGCLVLSVAAAFLYKRFAGEGASGVSVGMKRLGEADA